MINWKELSNEIRADSAGHQTAGGRTACQTHVVFASEDRAAVFAQPSSAEELQRCCGCCLKKTSARVS